MILLVRQELYKLYHRFTPYVVYLAIVALVLLVIFGFKQNPHGWLSEDRLERRMTEVEIHGSPVNGTLICEFTLLTLAQLLLFLAPLVTGEIIGSEGGTGTLRMLLTRPRSRSAIWFAKLITAFLYTLSLAAVTMLSSLLLGWLVLGRGKLWEFSALTDNRVVILTENEAVRYLLLAYAVLAICVFAVASLAFMLGSFFDSGLIPGFATLGIVITLWITSKLPFDWIDRVDPYLFSSLTGRATEVMPTDFDPQTLALLTPWPLVGELVGLSVIYAGVFCLLGWWRFVRRDVTC